MMDDLDLRNYASILSSPLPQFIHDSADAIMRGKIFPQNSGIYYWTTSILCLLFVVLAALRMVNKSSSSLLQHKHPQRRSRRRSSSSVKGKRVVLVDEYGARVENVPCDYVPPPGQEVRKLLSSEEATAALMGCATGRSAPNGSGIVKVETATLASNDPMEDAHCYEFHKAPGGGGGGEGWWSYFGVFDGHYGRETSSYLRDNLTSKVHKDLLKLHKSSSSNPSSPQIDTTISTSFTDLDNTILSAARKKKASSAEIDRALQGSCALLAFHDSRTNDVRVAVTGDSRAVLGKRIGSTTTRWLPVELSVDQNFHNPHEEKRLSQQHPGENVVSNWRIMGELAVSRAFGDARLKWDVTDLPASLLSRRGGRDNVVHPRSKTPPYLTAEPVVKSTKCRPNRGDFLIMASDGLWDTLTNEDAVAIVGRWLDEHDPRNNNHNGGEKGEKRPRTKLTPDQEEKFVFVDDHAAVHLLRNALGAKDGKVRRSLSVPPDDMTAMVIFFE